MKPEELTKKIDQVLTTCSVEQLKSLVHKLASEFKNKDQSKLIKILNQVSGNKHFTLTSKEYERLKETEQDIYDYFYLVRKQEYFIVFTDITEYDWGYSYSKLVFDLDDNEGIFQTIIEACELVNDYVSFGKYEDAKNLALDVLSLKIYGIADDDSYGSEQYREDILFQIGDIKKDNIEVYNLDGIISNVNQLLINAFLSTYIVGGKDYLDDIFRILKFAHGKISLERLFREYPNKLGDFQNFLFNWIDFLGQRKCSLLIKSLIESSISLISDQEKKLSCIVNNARRYPELLSEFYDSIYPEDIHKRISYVLNVLDKLDKDLVIRSEIALLAAKDVQKIQDDDSFKELLLLAFESDTSVENYLRFVLNFTSQEDHDRISKILDYILSLDDQESEFLECEEDDRYNSIIDQSGNLVKIVDTKFEDQGEPEPEYEYEDDDEIDNKDFCLNVPWLDDNRESYSLKLNTSCKEGGCFHPKLVLKFLDKRFDEILDIAKDDHELLNIDDNYPAISLFILYLFEGEHLGPACKCILKDIKINSRYKSSNLVGFTDLNGKKNDREIFYECFKRWKELNPISDEEKTKIINAIDDILMRHYLATAAKNMRNGYEECAKHVVAMGEVKESLGEKNGKENYIMLFIEKYPKRVGFANCLQNFCVEDEEEDEDEDEDFNLEDDEDDEY